MTMEGASERGSPDEGMDTEGRLTRERTRRPREVAQSPALNADLALRRHKPREHDFVHEVTLAFDSVG